MMNNEEQVKESVSEVQTAPESDNNTHRTDDGENSEKNKEETVDYFAELRKEVKQTFVDEITALKPQLLKELKEELTKGFISRKEMTKEFAKMFQMTRKPAGEVGEKKVAVEEPIDPMAYFSR